MNFKKYHESKNLLDKTTFTTVGATIEQIKDGIRITTQSNGYAAVIVLDVLQNTDYSLSYIWKYISGNSANTVRVFAGTGSSTQIAIFTYSNGGTFNTGNNTKINIWFYAAFSTAATVEYANIMLNLGSEALPYEPYSSEVWHDIPHYIHNTATDTITTLPAVIYADGNNATVGISGNMEQNGAPTPQNPIQPSECGEKTAQLYFKKIANATINADGRITSNNSFDCYLAKVEANKQYIGTGYVYSFFVNEPYIGSGVSYDSQRVVAPVSNGFTSPIDGYVAVRHTAGATDEMLNLGSTALPYEPYGYKIPISSANTTTPVYLGEVQSTRIISKYEFTGEENFRRTSAGYFYAQKAFTNYNSSLYGVVATVFSHYKAVANNGNGNLLLNNEACLYSYYQTPTQYKEVYINDTRFTTADEFNSYLAQQYANGTPVCVWYVLETETTGIVNEPLRKIGDYADTVLGITIPTIAGANSFDVLTTLKPSEVTVNYKGWHTGAVHERENGQWN